ncbi:MAG: rod shape-determining protein MreC [Alphaproteobacteria bacterium]
MTHLRRASFASIVLPPRGWFERASFGGLIGLALILLLLGRAQVGVVEQATHAVRDALTPVMTAVARPSAAMHDGFAWIGRQFALAEENARLRAQVERLSQWRAEATRLEVENASLREVLHAQRRRPVPIERTATVVADSRSPFVHTRLLDTGSRDGVEQGMAAMATGGLAGRVVDVAPHSARLLLLTDFNSRLPVLVLPSRDPAILSGDNGPLPRLDFMPLTPQVQAGDRVVTSGAAGLLPVGLPVGQVVRDEAGALRVRPALDVRDLRHVRLVRSPPLPADFGAGVAERGAGAPRRGG